MSVLLNDQICIKPMGLYAGGEKAMFCSNLGQAVEV
jgi:hypothetical protein